MKNVAVDLFNRPKLHKLLLNMNRTTLPRFTDSNNHHDKMTLTWLEGSPRSQHELLSSGWVWRSTVCSHRQSKTLKPDRTQAAETRLKILTLKICEASHLTSWYPPRPASKGKKKEKYSVSSFNWQHRINLCNMQHLGFKINTHHLENVNTL